MKEVPKSFDAFSFLQSGPLYCENKDCEEFGYVTMVGIPDEKKEALPKEDNKNV
jgi:hypothetical protein